MAVKTKKSAVSRKTQVRTGSKTKSVKKAPAPKTAAKKTAPKKVSSKKAAAPKAAAPKAAAPKKAPAKAPAKRTAVPKESAKKSPVKKSSPKKSAKDSAKTTSELLKAIKKARGAETVKAKNKGGRKEEPAAAKPPRRKSAEKKPLPIVPPMQKPVEIVVPTAKPKPKKGEVKFSKTALDKFKKELLMMRDHFTGQTHAMKHDALQRDDEVNPEEDGTDAFMRLQALNQMNDQQHVVADIDKALIAIEKGTYGICEMCGCLIAKQRLAVRPFAKFCITCKSEMENGGRHNRKHR